MTITEGPTEKCACGEMFHFPKNLEAHQTTCMYARLHAANIQIAGLQNDVVAACEQLKEKERLNGELRDLIEAAKAQIGGWRELIAEWDDVQKSSALGEAMYVALNQIDEWRTQARKVLTSEVKQSCGVPIAGGKCAFLLPCPDHGPLAEARKIVEWYQEKYPYCYNMCEIDVPKDQFMKLPREELDQRPKRHDDMCKRIQAFLGPKEPAAGNPWAPNKDICAPTQLDVCCECGKPGALVALRKTDEPDTAVCMSCFLKHGKNV